jgi:hypothetical protein
MRTGQSGAGLLIPVVLVVTVAAFAVVVAASQSGADIQGSDANAESLQALFVAETGVERALKRFATGTACGGALAEAITDLSTIGLGMTAYRITIGAGLTTDFSAANLTATQCRVPVTGTVIASNVSRTIHAIVDRNLLDGADNPTFDNPLTAGAPTGWTNLTPNTAFALNGGPDGTAPNCRRSAWIVRENSLPPPANNRTAFARANLNVTITAGSTTTIAFHRRIIDRTTACATPSGAGPALPAACTVSAEGTICFQMNGAAALTVSHNADPAGTSSASCPSTFSPCETSYQAGYPAKITLTVAMTGVASITTFDYYMQLRSAGRKEMFLDHIEAINDTAVGAAHVKVWRDCSTAPCP